MRAASNTTCVNSTDISEFIILGFGELQDLHYLIFLFFLAIYIITIAGNFIIISLVMTNQHLQTPMYFFLGNLSCMEMLYSSAILPRILASLITGDGTILIIGCMVQLYFFGFLVCTECYLLAVMSYDRYLTICHPLHYGTLMNDKFCLQLAAGSWTSAFVPISIIIMLMSSLHYCGPNEINHFFCDFPSIITLVCNDTRLVQNLAVILSALDTFIPFALTLLSYFHIIATVFRIPSVIGRKKAFATCSSHLMVVTIFYGSLMVVYISPKVDVQGNLHKVFSLFYTVVTPMVNPLIYSLRNKEVKETLRKTVSQWVAHKSQKL